MDLSIFAILILIVAISLYFTRYISLYFTRLTQTTPNSEQKIKTKHRIFDLHSLENRVRRRMVSRFVRD